MSQHELIVMAALFAGIIIGYGCAVGAIRDCIKLVNKLLDREKQ